MQPKNYENKAGERKMRGSYLNLVLRRVGLVCFFCRSPRIMVSNVLVILMINVSAEERATTAH